MIDPSDAQTLRSRARVGLVFREKWRIMGLVGSGGMAAVYRAVHCNNGREAAIKVLHPDVAMNPEARARFLREGYLANKVKHRGAVEVLDDDTAEDGSVFIVMELLDGESLETYRERVGTVDPVTTLRIADMLLDVLASAHANGIVHRDIKPDNIFLMKNGYIKVLDFGIARLRENAGNQMMTGTGAMGTPAYMPQEQARGHAAAIGPRTDLWAVGATMFSLVTGRIVHEAETVQELFLAAMTRKPPPMASLFPGVPRAFCAIVDRALEFEPEQRFPDARAMQEAVRHAIQQLAPVGAQPMAPLAAPAPGPTHVGLGPQVSPGAVAMGSPGYGAMGLQAAPIPAPTGPAQYATGSQAGLKTVPAGPAHMAMLAQAAPQPGPATAPTEAVPWLQPSQPSQPGPSRPIGAAPTEARNALRGLAASAPQGAAPVAPSVPQRDFVTGQAVTVGGTTDASLPVVKPSRTPLIVAGVATALLLMAVASVALLRGPASGGKGAPAASDAPATPTQAATTPPAPTTSATVSAGAEPVAPSATASAEPVAPSANASASPRPASSSSKPAGGKAGPGPKKSERDLLQRRD